MSNAQGPQGPGSQNQQQKGARPGAMTMAMQAVQVRPGGPKILRIGIIQGDKMIEERIVRKRETVTVGPSEKNNFVVSSMENNFELFQLVGADYILNFTADMKGRVGLTGGVQSLDQLRSTGAARNAGNFFQVKLNDSSRGRVTIGETTLLFQFIDPPPVQPKPQLPAAVVGGFVAGIDWLFTAFVMFSFMSHFGFIIFLENADWPMQPTIATIPDRVAELIFSEPEPPPEPVEETPTTDDAPAEEEVAEAETPSPTPREQADSPSSESDAPPTERQAAANSDARMAAEQAVANVDQLLLGALGSGDSAFANVLANGAVTSSAEEIMGVATGVGVASSAAGGTLRDRSGGNRAGGATAGLGGLAGGQVATGTRTEGTAVREDAPRGRFRPPSDVDDESGSGEFDSSVVVRMITTRRSAIQACYERELRQQPTLQGRVTVSLTIQESGSLTNVRATENSTGSEQVASCVVRVVQGFRFNPGPEGGSVTYAFPFVFEPQN